VDGLRASLKRQPCAPDRLFLSAELERLFVEIIHGNEQRQHFLMSRATKAS
jgi:hypothetical protein